VTSPGAGDMEDLLHKLSVIQGELESQNEKLKQAEEAWLHYSLLFHDAPVAYVVLDKIGSIEEVNREGERLIGLRASTLRGTPLSRYLSADSHVTFQAHLQASLSTNKRQRCEVALRNWSTKAPVNVLIETVSLSSPTGSNSARCALIDITEGKKTKEEQLVIANFGIQSAISAIGFADLHGRVTFVNDSFLRLWGYDRVDEVLGRHISEFATAGMDGDGVRAARSGRGYVGEGLGKKKDGSSFHVEAAVSTVKTVEGQPICMMASFIDTTERTRTEAALRESEERYRVAIECSNDGVALVRGDKHVFVNQRLLDMFGYEREEIIDQPIFMTIHPDDREMTARHIQEGESGEKARNAFEFRGITKDGATKYIEASVARVTYRGGPAGLAYLRDITERKQAEEKLQKSRLQLEEAANLAKIAYWERDEATDEFIFNDAFYDLYGTTAEREGGYRMQREEYRRRFVHPDDLEELRKQIAENRSRPHIDIHERYEHRVIRPDGEVMHVLNRNRLIFDPDGRILKVIGVNQDITARKRMEDALRESEERLRAIFDGSRDAIAVTKGWIRVFVNPAYVSLFGYESADEPLGKPIFDDIAPESRDFVMQLAKKRRRGEPVPPFYEETALKKDGTRFFAEVAVSSYMLKGEEYSCVILRDITDRKQAEDEARLLKHSIDVHYDGAYWIDGNARLVYVNDAACKSLGYERGELIGKSLLDVNVAATPEAMQKVWERIQKGGYFLGESVHRRKDGSEFPVEIITTYVQFDGREFACGFARDITEKKKLEGQLRQAQKMETIGTLSAGIAHDFKNILTAIEGFANLGIKYVQDDSKAKRHLDRIRRAVERGKDLVGQILTYSHKSEDEPEPTELIPVIKESIRMLRASLRPTVEIRENLTTASALVLGDPTQAQQIIINLATNAAYAMGQRGGTLTIELSDFSLISQNAPAPGMSEGPYLKLSISDTGTGMDRQTMERVFDPFFTTKKRAEGTGLGLWVVHSIVKKQRGAITVRSAPGEGSTFEVFLPRFIG